MGVRSGNTKSDFNESFGGIVEMENFFLSVAAGIYFESWWVFGLTFVGGALMLAEKHLAPIYCFIISLFPTAIIGGLFWLVIGWDAAVVIGFFTYVFSYFVHLTSCQVLQDITDEM
jgi:hypothetical protein